MEQEKAVDLRTQEQHEEFRRKSLELFPQMLGEVGNPLKDFKKATYPAVFQRYVERTTEHMDAIEDAYMTASDKEAFLREAAEAFLAQVQKQLAEKSKRQQEDLLVTYNMCLVTYVNPALVEHNQMSGKPLVEELLRQWKEAFPKTSLQYSDFETINGGFKQRYCYITTAVCESRGRGDDCYELNLFRDYRDGYLLQQPEGEELIRQYYDVAPTIVKHIDRKENRSQIYEEIWQQYLNPCMVMIQQKQFRECGELYQRMVHQLTERYFYGC